MSALRSPSTGRAWERLPSWLPRGGSLPDDAWATRHRGIAWLAVLHVPVLLAITAWHRPTAFSFVAIVPVALLALAALRLRASRSVLSSLATLSLLGSTALLVHLFDGLIEMHFHFFVVIAVVAVYQAWTPYLLALAFVLAHHAVMGLAMPMAVYNHPSATAHPVLFAVVHASFVLAESAACLTYWRITEQALEREREQRSRAEVTSEELAAAHQEISDLMAMVSHDLRAPLTVINGNVELALDSWEDLDETARREMVRRVGVASHSLEEMLTGTLTLTVMDASGLEPRPTVFRIDTQARQVLETLGDPLADVDLSQLRPATVTADRQHVQQVLANLVTNAVKYGEAPYVVSASRVDEVVELCVEDSGPGVPAEFVPRLFDRYSRSEVARRGRERGTGIGLYIVRTLLEANAGEIVHEPRPGGGSRFTVRLPAGERTLAAPLPRGGERRGPGSVSSPV